LNLLAQHVLSLFYGEVRELPFARALAPGPEALLFDERLPALDAGVCAWICRALEEIGPNGPATVSVPHHADELPKGNRIRLAAGRLVRTGCAFCRFPFLRLSRQDVRRMAARRPERGLADLAPSRAPVRRSTPASASDRRRPAPAPSPMREIRGPMFIDTQSGTYVDRRPPPPTISRREFEAELDRLVRAFARNEENPGSVSSEGCRRCVSCMFCRDCEECYRCTHCRRCRACSHLTHCVDCTALHDCAYCISCENCTRSSYLVLCRSCSECTYCFGCVGLVKKDFHILNKAYSRQEFFELVKKLKAELGIK